MHVPNRAAYPPPPHHIPAPPPIGPHRSQSSAATDGHAAFADIGASDYARDILAVLALVISLFLPWNAQFSLVSGGQAGLIIIIVLITLLSLSSVAFPYLGRLGMLGPGWRELPISLFRLGINLPYLLMVVGFLGYDIVRGFSLFGDSFGGAVVPGLGMAALFGLAGAILAAQPRTAELQNRPGTGWLSATKILIFGAVAFTALALVVSMVYVLTGSGTFSPYRSTPFELLLVLIAWAVLALSLSGVFAAGLARNFPAWRRTSAVLAPSILTAAFFLSFGETTKLESFHGVPYFALLFWVAAGICAAAPVTDAAAEQGHAGYTWLAAVRNGFTLVAVWGFVSVPVTISMAVLDTGAAGEMIAFGVFSLLIGVLAVLGVRASRPQYVPGSDPRPSREVVLGVSLGLLLLTLGRMVAGVVVRDYAVIEPFEVIVPMFVVALAIALVAAAPVRDLYAGVPLFAALASTAPHAETAGAPDGGPPVHAHQVPTSPVPPVSGIASQFGPAPGSHARPSPSGPVSLIKDRDTEEAVPAVPPGDPAATGSPWAAASSSPAPSSTTPTPTLDPATSAAELFRLAQERPDLRPAIAVHPNIYPGLRQWLTDLGDPAVEAALTGTATTPEPVTPPDEPAPTTPAAPATPTIPATPTLDPATSAAELFRLAQERPDLRPAIAVHPNLYPGLRQWLTDLGDPAVDAAFTRAT